MKRTSLDTASIHQLHLAGELDVARAGYLAILDENPDDVAVLHALGILHVQEEDFSTAVHYFKTAIQYDSSNPQLYLNLGNALKSQHLYSDAVTALEKAIALNPDYVAALNSLGTVCHAEDQFDKAIYYYHLAIEKQPEFLDAYYNLGLALIKKSAVEDAIIIYEKILAEAPEHGPARFQLARLLLQKNEFKTALPHFLKIEETHPFHFETQTNLAICYLKLGMLNQAKTHYVKALDIEPHDIDILYNLGVISLEQGHTDNAIQYYQRALQINPNYFPAHNNIGVAFLAKNHIGFALQHFKEALRLVPGNKAIEYTVKMLAQDQRLSASPPDYIKNLFNAYADHYEEHLLQSLDYKVPEELYASVMHVIQNKNVSWDILDLGCGTGLCGMVFHPLAKKLIGTDLAKNMLAVAAEKNIYTALLECDFLTSLQAEKLAYDLIIAGDALVYVGDLQVVFAAAYNALRAHGLFAFNTEITKQPDYAMNQSGRFSHQKKYLDDLALQLGFKIVFYQEAITRQQNNEPVIGHLYVLEKSI
jgi:predicted TPR repeat methyltransferase